MSTTRSQKRRNDQQEGYRNVSEGFVSPIVMENPCSSNQDVEVTGPSRPKSPRIENGLLENLRVSLKEEITSEIKNLLIESQKEMLKLLKPETRENARDNFDEETENEIKSFYTPTKSVRINSTQNDPNVCRNIPNEFFFTKRSPFRFFDILQQWILKNAKRLLFSASGVREPIRSDFLCFSGTVEENFDTLESFCYFSALDMARRVLVPAC